MMKITKIEGDKLNLKVNGQACKDDCVEKNVWVGKTNGNVSGCVKYDTVYTSKTTVLW